MKNVSDLSHYAKNFIEIDIRVVQSPQLPEYFHSLVHKLVMNLFATVLVAS